MASIRFPGARRFEQPFMLPGVVDPWRLPGASIATPAIATYGCSTLRPAVPSIACRGRQWLPLADSRDSPWPRIAAVGKLGRCCERQLTGAVASSHYRPRAVVGCVSDRWIGNWNLAALPQSVVWSTPRGPR